MVRRSSYAESSLMSMDDDLVSKAVNARHLDWYYRSRVLGHTHQSIADEHGVTREAVTMGIRKAEKAHTRSVFTRVQEVKARQSMLYDHLARESISEWEKSKDRVETTERYRDATDKDGVPLRDAEGNTVQVKEVTTKALLGDVRYLAEARQQLDKIDRLFGLEAPRETKHTGTPHTVHMTQSLTVEKLESLDADQLEPIRSALGQLQQATRGLEESA